MKKDSFSLSEGALCDIEQKLLCLSQNAISYIPYFVLKDEILDFYYQDNMATLQKNYRCLNNTKQ